MTIKHLAPPEAIEAVTSMDSIEDVRKAASDLGIKFSGNTGLDTLKGKILGQLEAALENEEAPAINISNQIDLGGDDEEIQVYVPPVKKKKELTIGQLLMMDATEEENPNIRRQIIRAQALRQFRVKITNLDPTDAPLNGAIITTQNKYTGKVSKYVPFGDESENGYHLPFIILEHLKDAKFPLRKEVKGGRFGVKTYKTVMVNKFAIEILPHLTVEELMQLAQHQRASQSIDNS